MLVWWKLISFRLKMVLISMQDSRTVCAECTRAWQSFWPEPMELIDDVGQMEAYFSLFGDIVSLDAR
jgi:hypothetical protein